MFPCFAKELPKFVKQTLLLRELLKLTNPILVRRGFVVNVAEEQQEKFQYLAFFSEKEKSILKLFQIALRLESIKDSLAMNAAIVIDRFDILRESFKIKKTDPVPVGRAVEGNGAASVSRTQYRNVHMLILMVLTLYTPHTVGQAQPVLSGFHDDKCFTSNHVAKFKNRFSCKLV